MVNQHDPQVPVNVSTSSIFIISFIVYLFRFFCLVPAQKALMHLLNIFVQWTEPNWCWLIYLALICWLENHSLLVSEYFHSTFVGVLDFRNCGHRFHLLLIFINVIQKINHVPQFADWDQILAMVSSLSDVTQSKFGRFEEILRNPKPVKSLRLDQFETIDFC